MTSPLRSSSALCSPAVHPAYTIAGNTCAGDAQADAQDDEAHRREVNADAGHTLYDAAYRLSEACDQTEDGYAGVERDAMESLTRRIEALLAEAYDVFGVPSWKRGQ